MKLFNGLRLFLVVSLAMFAMVAGCVKSNPMTAESHSGSGVDIVAYVQGVAVKDSITPGVIMLCAQLADTIADSTISTITWQIVGGAVIGVKYTHVQTMWVPDTGHYTVQVTVLRKNGTSLQNMRNFIVYKSGVVSVPVLPGDSIFMVTFGKKTVNGFLPVTIRIATSVFTNSAVPVLGNSAKFILWGPGQGNNGTMSAIDTAKNVTYKYIQDTAYPNTKYNGCAIVQWNGTNMNSLWADTSKCHASKYWLQDSAGNWAFRFMTPSGDTVYVPDTSLMAGASGDTGASWVMRMKIVGDTTTYFFNPSLSTTSMASFIKNGVVTTLNLTSAGTVYYLKLSRAQVQAQVSSDGYIHISYDGSSMTGSVFYQASSGNLAYFFALAKKKV
jgi:hypothetical protein